MTVSHHFAPDYTAARARFLDAARSAGATLAATQHPLRGPQGEKLFCDTAWLGPVDAKAVLVTMSATHGGEGYCGSGCQTAWFADGHWRTVPDGVAQLAIHAINPHGMAWMRRVTEDNVDLNRNFADPTRPLPVNAGYDDLHDALCPRTWDAETRAETAQRIDAYEAAHGQDARRAAVSAGQFSHPDGLFFGGHAPTWSHRVLRRIFEADLVRARSIAVLDYHTGLGPRGYGELIAAMPPSDPDFALLKAWLGEELTSPEQGTSSSVVINGMNGHGMRRFAPATTRLAPVALEYGTEPPARVFDALRADNWLHWHGDPTGPEAAAIKAEIRACFSPDDPSWHAPVVERAIEICGRLAAGLATL